MRTRSLLLRTGEPGLQRHPLSSLTKRHSTLRLAVVWWKRALTVVRVWLAQGRTLRKLIKVRLATLGWETSDALVKLKRL